MSDPQLHRPRRLWWGIFLVLGLAFIGLVVGTAIGARFFVPKGSGMAGPAIALGYGVLGGLSALSLAGFLLWKAGFRQLRLWTLGVCGISMVVLGAVIWRAVTLEQQRRADHGLDRLLPAPQGWSLVSRLPESDPKRSFRELEIDAASWSFEYTAVGPEAARCEGRLIADEAENLARLVSALTVRERPFCSGASGPPGFFLRLQTSESSSLAVEASRDCLRDDRDLAEIELALRRIPIVAVSHGRVDCL